MSVARVLLFDSIGCHLTCVLRDCFRVLLLLFEVFDFGGKVSDIIRSGCDNAQYD